MKEHDEQLKETEDFSDDEDFSDELNPVDTDGYPEGNEDYPEDADNLINDVKSVKPKEKTESQTKDALQEKTNVSFNEKELLERLSEIASENNKQQKQITEILSIFNNRLKTQEKAAENKETIRQDISDIQKYMFGEFGITIGADDPIVYALLYNKNIFESALTDYESALTRVTLDLDKKLKDIYEFSEKMEERKKQFIAEIIVEHSKQRRKTVGQIDKAIVDAINLALEKAGIGQAQPDDAVSEFKTMKYLLLGVLAASILNFFL
ncbi:hypothetical protein [Pelistega sp. MC2]|uniref:hypothetical protein n=1 Tax=Pelistega sp. MC2 TaxID=1720297 RepID=UPI0008D8E1C4|nr:hypothetical protein [Pelistega sp. MC2]